MLKFPKILKIRRNECIENIFFLKSSKKRKVRVRKYQNATIFSEFSTARVKRFMKKLKLFFPKKSFCIFFSHSVIFNKKKKKKPHYFSTIESKFSSMNFDFFGNPSKYENRNFIIRNKEWSTYFPFYKKRKDKSKFEKIQPKPHIFNSKENWSPKSIYEKKRLIEKINSKKSNIRNIAIIGHLHHGKSSLVNCLASSLHLFNEKSLFTNFSDFFFLEQHRRLSIHVSVITLLACDKKGNSYVIGLLDTPGHPDFFDQVITAMAFSEGGILVLDLAEGVLLGTELSLRYSIFSGLSIILVINSIDRLILELNFSPKRIQKKIIQALDELNSIIEESMKIINKKRYKNFKFFNPIENNVCFSSLIQGWTFTLEQYSEMYLASQPSVCISSKDLTNILWGNYFYRKRAPINFEFRELQGSTMFEEFILIPLFKIMFFNLGETVLHLRKFMEVELGMFGLNRKEVTQNRETSTVFCMLLFFGGCRDIKLVPNHTGLISSVISHFSRFQKPKIFMGERKNFSTGYIGKLLPSKNFQSFLGVTKLFGGRVNPGISICIITEGHSLYLNQEYRTLCLVEQIFLPVGCYHLNITEAPLGSIIFLKGVGEQVKKSALFVDLENGFFDFYEISPSIVKKNLLEEKSLSVIITSKTSDFYHQNSLYKNIRTLSRTYPNLICKIEKTGEIVLIGTGELFLDSVLFELQEILGEVGTRISKTFVKLRETVSPKHIENQFCFLKQLSIGVGENTIKKSFHGPKFNTFVLKLKNQVSCHRYLKRTLKAGYICKNAQNAGKTNKLKANSFWCVGPYFPNFSNCELRATQEDSVFPRRIKKVLTEGFIRAITEGPIYGEQMNEITYLLKFPKSLGGNLREKGKLPYYSTRDFHSVFEKNNPKIQEPWFFCELVIPYYYFSPILKFIEIKNGLIISLNYFDEKDELVIRINVPIFAIFDFKQELWNLTQGRGSCFFCFDFWKCNDPEFVEKNTKAEK